MQQPKRFTSAQASALHLSVEEVEKLLSPEAGVDARMGIARKMTDEYAVGQFSGMEATIAEQIFRLMVRDTEVKVRMLIAEQLKATKQVPHDIIMTMARDPEDLVALPVLKHSDVLTPDDLMLLVRATDSTSRHVAMSEREQVPPSLAGALLARGKPEVAHALLKNDGAQLDEAALAGIVERFKTNGRLMQDLAGRANLPVSVAEKVVSMVSGALADNLSRKYSLTPKQLNAAADRARETATLELLKHNSTPYELEKLINQLSATERLTASLIFAALCQGHIGFFEMALARMSGVPYANAQKLINDRGELGFRALYNKSGLPAGVFSAVRLLLLSVHEIADSRDVRRGEDFANRVCDKLFQLREEQPVENLDYMIALAKNSARMVS